MIFNHCELYKNFFDTVVSRGEKCDKVIEALHLLVPQAISEHIVL